MKVGIRYLKAVAGAPPLYQVIHLDEETGVPTGRDPGAYLTLDDAINRLRELISDSEMDALAKDELVKAAGQ